MLQVPCWGENWLKRVAAPWSDKYKTERRSDGSLAVDRLHTLQTQQHQFLTLWQNDRRGARPSASSAFSKRTGQVAFGLGVAAPRVKGCAVVDQGSNLRAAGHPDSSRSRHRLRVTAPSLMRSPLKCTPSQTRRTERSSDGQVGRKPPTLASWRVPTNFIFHRPTLFVPVSNC